jgi:phosphate transport system substrate-binding protein
LGATDADWKDRPVSLYGRNAASGTYGFFKEHALAKGDFRDTVKEQAGSASVVMGISEDRLGLGYSGIGFTTPGVKMLSIAEKDGGEAFAPSYENVVNGKYPIWRPLYIYILKDPAKPLAPLTREFLRFVLSKEGQEIVVKDGFYPLSADQAAEMAKLLD